MLFDVSFLFGAGFLGGVLNSVAGGGSFITFPALLLVGVDPVSANATNTFASCAGYLSGAYGFRDDLYAHKEKLLKFALISVAGGILGAWLLLQTPESLFREAIPWLLLFATFFFIFGAKINIRLRRLASYHRHASLFGRLLSLSMLFGVCIYGGFFNAGLGIIILSYLALSGHTDINAMNGIKLLISSTTSATAIILFAMDDVIAWHAGAFVLAGALAGGYVAARFSKKLSRHHLRAFVILASCGTTIYFFFDVYAK